MSVASLDRISAAPSWRTVRALLALNIVALVAVFGSSHWDAAEHAKGAVDRFWYAPHFGIYFAILAAAIVSFSGLLVLVRAGGSLAAILRANAALVVVVVANLLSFTGAPFDAWWHATFGIDLTVWSPPHLHLLAGIVLSALGCCVYFLDDDPLDTPLRYLQFPHRSRNVLLIGSLVLALLMAVYLFVEYEGGSTFPEVLDRPRWAYPLLWSIFVPFVLALATAMTRRIGTATLIGAIYVLARLAMIGFDRAVLDFRGVHGYPLLLPALVFDLLLTLVARRGLDDYRRIALAGLITSIALALTTPLWWSLLQIAPDLTVTPWISAWPAALVAGTIGSCAGWWTGTALRRLRPVVR